MVLPKTKLSDFQGASDDFSMAIKLDPNNSEPYYNKGIAEILLGQNQKGCEDLKKAKALGHDRAQEMIIRFCK